MQKTHTLLLISLSLVTFNTFTSQVSTSQTQNLRSPTNQDIDCIKRELSITFNTLLSKSSALTKEERTQLITRKTKTPEERIQLLIKSKLTEEECLSFRIANKTLQELKKVEQANSSQL